MPTSVPTGPQALEATGPGEHTHTLMDSKDTTTHDVDGLCKELPARVAQLILEEGGRLAK